MDEGYGDTANDSSPHNNDGDLAGTCPGAATCPSWTNDGKFNKALSFDGGDYVDCGSPSSLDNITDAITISAWMRKSNTDTQFILSKYAGEADASYELYTSSIARFRLYDSGGGVTVDGISTISDGNWHHVVGTLSGTTMTIYVDGVSENTGTLSSSIEITTNTVDIGRRGNGNYNFNGTIDEVKIYPFALTEDEVRVEYNQGKAIVLGATGTESDGKTPSFSANREYCIPGDTTTCNPPIAEWKMDERTGSSVYDTSENNNTGTIVNATYISPGKYGSALDFDGDGDYVSVISNSTLDITTAWTISGWFKSADTSGGQVGIIHRDDGGTDRDWVVLIQTSGYFYAHHFVGGVQTSQTFSTLGTVDDNAWHFFAVVNDGTDLIGYIDTSYETASGDGGTTDTDAADLQIGVWRTGNSEYFNGSIDHVKIYDYARTPAQVAWDYNRGKPVAHWKFDECQGNTAHDESGNGNDGTITIGGNGSQTALGTCTDGLSTSAWYKGVDGKINSAMSFDGVDDYVDCGNDSSLDITDAITIEAWVKPANLDNQMTIFVGNDDGGGNTKNNFGVSSQKLSYDNWLPAGGSVSSNTNLTLNEYQHVAVVKNGNSIIFYLNGKNDGGGTADVYSGATIDRHLIGARYYNSAAQKVFNGDIDEVKVFNYALTAEQIKMEYNNGAVNFK
jgi:hypothetical protein